MPAKDQQVIPMIAYEDGAAALDWLAAAFGFHERTRMTGKDGRISHAEMEAGDGLIMLASPTPDYEGPRRHRVGCEPARKWSSVPWVIDGVLVSKTLWPTTNEQRRPVPPSSQSRKAMLTVCGIAPRTSRVTDGCSWSAVSYRPERSDAG